MGYYTRYKITATTEREQEVRDRIAVVSGYGDTYDLAFDDDRKWYDHIEHCVAVSLEFPDVTIRVQGSGEEHGDEWVRFYRNGKTQRFTRGEWTPPQEPVEGAWKGPEA